MAFESSTGYVAPSTSNLEIDASLPIFNVEHVALQFSISSDFVAAAVANNVLILALSTGRILRIDLDSPADIDDIDLPKKPSEIGIIRRLFLAPSASHLIITTTLAENFYLHAQVCYFATAMGSSNVWLTTLRMYSHGRQKRCLG